jgi:hypothetical protein
MTRREWLSSSAAFVVGARAEPIRTISPDPEHYHGWPTLGRTRSGELLVVYSGGREAHICPFGRVELMRSRDDGRSWSWPQILWDSPIDDRDSGVLATPQGSLLVTTFTSLAYQPLLEKAKGWPEDKLQRWRAAQGRLSAGERESLVGCWMLRSTDGGLSWSAPYRVPLNSPHGPIALSDGRLLYAGKRLWEAGRKVGVAESRDDGESWWWLAEIPARAGDTVEQYHELHAVETSDHRIIVHIRNQNKAQFGETLQCESADGGMTWSVPHSIGVWGLPSHLLRLQDGRLLMTYGYRRRPFGNQARISADGGRTWSEAMTISDDGASGDLGYPSTVELPGGGLLTAWYELPGDSTKAVLRLARWSLA